MTLRWWTWVALGLVAGCGEGDQLDVTEQALSNIGNTVSTIDRAVSRASGFGDFRQRKIAYDRDPGSSGFSMDSWSFVDPLGRIEYTFVDTDGVAMLEPDDATEQMSLRYETRLGELDLVGLFGVPGTMQTEGRATTTGLSGYTPRIELDESSTLELALEDDGVRFSSSTAVQFQGSFEFFDRGPEQVPRYCPRGTAAGEMSVFSESQADGETRSGHVDLTFEVALDGNTLSWAALRGDTIVGEGERPSGLAAGCRG